MPAINAFFLWTVTGIPTTPFRLYGSYHRIYRFLPEGLYGDLENRFSLKPSTDKISDNKLHYLTQFGGKKGRKLSLLPRKSSSLRGCLKMNCPKKLDTFGGSSNSADSLFLFGIDGLARSGL